MTFNFPDSLPTQTLDYSNLPPPILEYRQEVHEPRGKLSYWVVRDDLLVGGTKTRLLEPYIRTRPERNFVMGSIFVDAGQSALAYSCKQHDRKATIFVAKRNEPTYNTKVSLELGAEVIGVRPGFLSNVRTQARKYQHKLPDSFLFVNRMNLPEMVHCVAAQARQIPLQPKEVWTCAGSGTIAKALAIAWPDAKHYTVRIGAPPDVGAAYLYESPEDFFDMAKEQPPFPTNPYYDAKAWHYFVRYAKQDSLFWNVAL